MIKWGQLIKKIEQLEVFIHPPSELLCKISTTITEEKLNCNKITVNKGYIIQIKIKDLSSTLDQMDLKNMYRTFHPTATESKILSSTHRIFSRIDNLLGHQTNFKFKMIENVLSFLTSMVQTLTEISNRKNIGKFTDIEIKQHSSE
jgi:hypothetical protein